MKNRIINKIIIKYDNIERTIIDRIRSNKWIQHK